jgi:uncharacterized protein YceK
MPLISRFLRIICLLLLVTGLQGCGGLIKVAYNQAPDALYWWMDSVFDFKEVQTLRLRPDLEALHAWHRRNELPVYAELAGKAAAMAAGNLSTAQVCDNFNIGRARAIAAVERLEPTVVALAPTFKPEQIAHIEKELDKRNRKWREEWIEGSPAKRTAKRVKEAVSRAEMFYGNLDSRQIAVVRENIARSSYDPQISHREALRRQQDALATLRSIANTQPAEAKVRADMRALFDRSVVSPDAAYRSYQETITREGCASVAELHNATTPTQRAKAAQTLRGYEADFRELAAR